MPPDECFSSAEKELGDEGQRNQYEILTAWFNGQKIVPRAARTRRTGPALDVTWQWGSVLSEGEMQII